MKDNILIGSVVMYKNKKDLLVVTDMDIHEDQSSCCYDREYYVVPLEEAKKIKYVEPKKGRKIEVKFETTLPFTVVKTEAPFDIVKEIKYKITRKKAKKVTVYE